MSYVLRLLDDASRTLVVEALRQAASRRELVAREAAGDLRAERRAGKDVRSRALRVTDLLAEADELRDHADALADAHHEEAAPVTTAAAAREDLPARDDDHGAAAGQDPDERLTVPLADETAHLPDVETLEEDAPAPRRPTPPRGPTPDGDAAPTSTAGVLAATLANVDAAIARHDQGANP